MNVLEAVEQALQLSGAVHRTAVIVARGEDHQVAVKGSITHEALNQLGYEDQSYLDAVSVAAAVLSFSS